MIYRILSFRMTGESNQYTDKAIHIKISWHDTCQDSMMRYVKEIVLAGSFGTQKEVLYAIYPFK